MELKTKTTALGVIVLFIERERRIPKTATTIIAIKIGNNASIFFIMSILLISVKKKSVDKI